MTRGSGLGAGVWGLVARGSWLEFRPVHPVSADWQQAGRKRDESPASPEPQPPALYGINTSFPIAPGSMTPS
jgi:hypothetical protein